MRRRITETQMLETIGDKTAAGWWRERYIYLLAGDCLKQNQKFSFWCDSFYDQ